MKQPAMRIKNLDYYKRVNVNKHEGFTEDLEQTTVVQQIEDKPEPKSPDTNIQYKFNEKDLLQEILNYVNGTYSQHYVGNTKDIQVMDLLLANEPTGTEFSRGAAVKYVMRYGKKSGKNRKDLLKAIHYILFMLYAEDMNNENEVADDIK